MTSLFFATCPKAMENLLADELLSLGADKVKPTVAGAHFSGDLTLAYKVCLWSRLANRILLQLDSVTVKTQDDLYHAIIAIDWHRHLEPEGSFAVTFNSKNSTAISNSHFGALKVKDAIVDQMREKFSHRPSIDTEHPDIRVNVNLNGENAIISLDLSGDSLHRRGYRDTTIKAPIKENLAAALLIRCRWQDISARGGTLIDPMCGSGTLLIEASLIAADYAPGLLRNYFGFLGWRQHDHKTWQNLVGDAERRKTEGLKKLPVIAGFDHDHRNLNAARIHLRNAGLEKCIQLECKEISACIPDKRWQSGLVICNPPYGERMGDAQETALLYKQFGEVLKSRFKGWQAAAIIGDPELGFRIGIRSQKPVTFYNGALECKLLRMTVEEKAFFEHKPKTPEDRMERIQKLIEDPYSMYKPKITIETNPENQHIKGDDIQVTDEWEQNQETVNLYKQPYETNSKNTNKIKEPVNKLIPFMPFDLAQESVRQAHHERNQSLTVRPEPVEGHTQNFLNYSDTTKPQTLTAPDFANRLKKNLKSLSTWRTKNNITCYRIYDADLPEYAAAIDLYEDINKTVWLNVQEYEPPKTIDPAKTNQRLAALLTELKNIFDIPKTHISLKIRRKQKQTDQYEKLGDQGHFHSVEEHGCRLQVNFTDYLDTGLFLDHRPLRLMIQQQAQGKRFLNLFAYTGSATVHAAVGGALKTTTVDMSKTYLDWARANLTLNKCPGEHEFIQADCLTWLAQEAAHPYPRQYDLILLDPPTFSNSKRMDDFFDIQQDHVTLINQALKLLAGGGILYFSTNFRRFKLDQDAFSSVKIEDISAQTIPTDFARNPKIHYCWRITL